MSISQGNPFLNHSVQDNDAKQNRRQLEWDMCAKNSSLTGHRREVASVAKSLLADERDTKSLGSHENRNLCKICRYLKWNGITRVAPDPRSTQKNGYWPKVPNVKSNMVLGYRH